LIDAPEYRGKGEGVKGVVDTESNQIVSWSSALGPPVKKQLQAGSNDPHTTRRE